MALTKQDILSANDRELVEVAVPEWGGSVYVKPLDGNGRDRYDQLVQDKQFPVDEHGKSLEPDWSGIRVALLGMTLCDDQGSLFGFTEAELLALGDKSGAAIDRVYQAARKASGIGLREVEQAEKNSSAGQSENSGSSSASPTDDQSTNSNDK